MGQTAITGITTTTTDAPNTTASGFTFDNITRSITTITDSGGTAYTMAANSTNVFIRRNLTACNANNTSLTYASGPGTNEILSPNMVTAQSVLLGNNIYATIDNVFANGTSQSTGNIERIDFLFNGTVGIQAQSYMAIALFERGLVNAHDGFNISLITGLNTTTLTPTGFGSITSVSTIDFGTSNVSVDGVANYTQAYDLFRYNNGDNTSTPVNTTETGNQGIGGIIMSLFDLGANNNQTIYGYSISADDTTTRRNRYSNWNDTRYYPSDSTNGLDPYGANGQLWDNRPIVPEPSTYGAIFVGLSIVFLGVRRWRKRS